MQQAANVSLLEAEQGGAGGVNPARGIDAGDAGAGCGRLPCCAPRETCAVTAGEQGGMS